MKNLKTAFNLCLMIILFFATNAYLFNLTFMYVFAIPFIIMLPACSTKPHRNE